MRAELGNLNHCAVPFLSRADVNLSWYDSSSKKCVYSRVRNNRAGMLINFGEKFHPRHVYSSHPSYLNLKHFQCTPFIRDAFLRKTFL